MNASSRATALLLILVATVLFLGVGLVAHGGYNLLTLETVSEIVQRSGYYKEAGYGSLGEWRSQYMRANVTQLAIGSLILCVGGCLIAKARQRKHAGASKT
jgi:hypothetical protein